MLLILSAGVAAAPLVGSQQFATLLVSFCLLDCCTIHFAGLPVMTCLLTLQADVLHIRAIAVLLGCMHDGTHCLILVQCMVVSQGYVVLAGSCVRSFPQIVRMSKNKRCSLTVPMSLPGMHAKGPLQLLICEQCQLFAGQCCMVFAAHHAPPAELSFQLDSASSVFLRCMTSIQYRVLKLLLVMLLAIHRVKPTHALLRCTQLGA